MGAALVKNCFIADCFDAPASATPSRSSRNTPHVTPQNQQNQQLHGQRTSSRHAHHRILPRQPGQQPYATDPLIYGSHSYRKQSQYDWHPLMSDHRQRHRSPAKLRGNRERWDSRESNCSSSMSTEDEIMMSYDAAAQHKYSHRPSSRHSRASVAPEDSFYHSRSTHGSSSTSGSVSSSSYSSSSSSRRSRVSSPCFRHQDLLPPNYILEDLLGSGTTSKVYRCRRVNDHRVLACKVINKRRLAIEHHHKDDMVSQLRREVDILKSLDHPHIAKLQDAFENDTYIVLVMELLEGGELFDTIVDRGRLSEPDAKHIARGVLDAISYMHAKGITHRDLKPENLLLAGKATPGRPLQVKIIDFGFASCSQVPMTSVLGTGGYLAPEIVMQQPYTDAVDTWSFGVLVYLMLCGRLPFTTATKMQPGQRASSVYRLTFPDKYWTGVSPLARNLLQKLLVLNPSDRLRPADALHHPWFHVA